MNILKGYDIFKVMNKVWEWFTNLSSTIVLGPLKDELVKKKDLKPLNRSVNVLSKAVQGLNHAVIEIQDFIQTSAQNEFRHKIKPFQLVMSPIRLHPDFKPYVEKTNIVKQVKEKNDELVKWLKSKKPETGLDAQNAINSIVGSGKIGEFLNLLEYKKYVYRKGKTSEDAQGILAVYLYEVLISQVIKE